MIKRNLIFYFFIKKIKNELTGYLLIEKLNRLSEIECNRTKRPARINSYIRPKRRGNTAVILRQGDAIDGEK
jgi:hypothetical protein